MKTSEKKQSYVCENDEGEVVGTFCTIYGENAEPQYLDIHDGQWYDDSPYAVIHRIAADGSEKGIGTFCINWVYEKYGHIRIDTHGDNIVMQNLLKKLEFRYAGIIYCEVDDDPRLAYEKSKLI